MARCCAFLSGIAIAVIFTHSTSSAKLNAVVVGSTPQPAIPIRDGPDGHERKIINGGVAGCGPLTPRLYKCKRIKCCGTGCETSSSYHLCFKSCKQLFPQQPRLELGEKINTGRRVVK